jgi:DGQHR domain-containing protein
VASIRIRRIEALRQERLVDRAAVYALYGKQIDLGLCLVAKNLNLQSLRGAARLDKLAIISAPDVFDAVLNQQGTQRDTVEKHAREAFDYAKDAAQLPVEYEPRAFPDILMNARDLAAVEFYLIDEPDQVVDFSSFMDDTEMAAHFLGVRVNLDQVKFPKEKREPAISRVDGNHRLSGVELFLDEFKEPLSEPLLEELPIVPFSLFVGLDVLQEGRLFRDVNDNQQGVKAADLDSLEYRLSTPDQLRTKKLPLYIAVELAKEHRAFENIVFAGGSRKGLQEKGLKPLININALKSAVAILLKSGAVVFKSDQFKDDADGTVNLVNNFWTAVRKTFPEAWDNKRDYILLQSIGLNGFADYGGKLIERAVGDGSAEVEDFERYLAPVRTAVPLNRNRFEGIAGAGGATVVSTKLQAASSPAAVNLERIKRQVTAEKTAQQKIESVN